MTPLLISKARGKDKTPRYYFRFQPPGQTGKGKKERECAMRAGTDLEAAKREYRANLGLLKAGKDPYPAPVTLQMGKAQYLKGLANAPSTIEGKEQTLDFFIGWLVERWEVDCMGDIEQSQCEAYQTARKPNLSVASWQREVAYLRHWFKWAREQSPPLMVSDPGAKWVAPQAKSSKTSTKPIITDKETERLVKHMAPEVGAAWRFCVETGVRPGEMWALKVEQLNLADRAAIYIMRKTGNPRGLTYSKDLAETLKTLIESSAPSDLVFTDKGKPWDRHTWRRTVYEAAHAAGMMEWDSKNHRIVSGRAPNPHLARHTVATKLARLPEMDIKTLMEIMGWDNAETAMKYIHANQTKIRSFFDQIQKKPVHRVSRAPKQ